MTGESVTSDDVLGALSEVVDPELDEPITDLGFVRSVLLDDEGVTVHLRLPTAFCSPNFAYLMVSDAQDVLEGVAGVGRVRVLLDDHHDSQKINSGLAAKAGYQGTFGVEAVDSLDDLRRTFLRKAHLAALERCVEALLRETALTLDALPSLTLRDIPAGRYRSALLRRRLAIGLTLCPAGRVFVDDDGTPIAPDAIPMRLRFAKSVRISIEGNSHFCRGLLATRYADDDGTAGPRIVDVRSTSSVPVRRVS
ncbi:metal-sulfur cluster assembly factor [Rhodococcus coprophilus]|uniref:Mrp family protein n=1 Tax=Rhodococcus coprophilus TaxID=38310 RepID=A0A2X4U6D1_9NOCA|nr:iron-sulfur cluster assembly protein [Rhodococcus coprophilus]MBM7459012.1 metal-sulfur cluster biosynthetic enzyme [Rhodococcus coprophilus]SQI34541.1 Mrp family protein [Rhodococcus coprophilus]